MLIKRKLYSYLEERDFGEVKRANKAAKRAEMIELSARKAKDSGDIDRMVRSGRRRNLRNQSFDPDFNLSANRSKGDRLSNISLKRRNAYFDKRREVLGRIGDGETARFRTKHNYSGRPGTETGDVLANKGSKAERIARLSERNQIRYHNNNYNRGQERIKFGESTPKVEMQKTNTAPITTNTTPKITPTNTAPKITHKTTTTSTSFSPNKVITDTVTRAQPPTTPSISQTKITPKNGRSIFNNSLNPMKWSKGAKIGAGVAAGTALIGTGVYLYNKNKKKKED